MLLSYRKANLYFGAVSCYSELANHHFTNCRNSLVKNSAAHASLLNRSVVVEKCTREHIPKTAKHVIGIKMIIRVSQ